MAYVQGTANADVVVGTSGSDTMVGLAGHDIFVFGAATGSQDTVLDFGSTYLAGALSGGQEVPPVSSGASGLMSLALNRAQTQLDFSITTQGLDLGGQTAAAGDNVTGAHFHRGATGANGDIVFGFIGAPNNETQGETVVNAAAGAVAGQWDASEGANTTLQAQLPALLNNQIYVNFHTTQNPTGEIRAQALVQDAGLDRVDVGSLGVGDYTSLGFLMSESSGSTQITSYWNDQASTMTLQGVARGHLSATDFVFADATPVSRTGSNGADDLFGASGDDFLYGQGGGDRIFAGAGADFVDGGEGHDFIVGLTGDDRIYGGQGDDDVNGNVGSDLVSGDDGQDTVRGGQDNDAVYGAAGNDPHVNGNRGDDRVYGGDGGDHVYGGKDNDTVYGEAGDDTVSGDLGSDLLVGGSGADRFEYRVGAGNDWVYDFSAADGDRVQLAAGTTYTLGSHEGQALITLGSGESLGLAGVAASSFQNDWVVYA